MLKLLPACILTCWSILPLPAQDPCNQLNYHAFKAESIAGVYTDLEDLGTEIPVSEHDDGLSQPQEIGFTFEYMCQEFTQFIFSTNGFIKLGSEPLSDSDLFFSNAQSNDRGVFNSDTIADINLIVAFNHDLDAGTNGHEFRVHTSGEAPDRVCTIQWKDQREWTYNPAKQFDNIDFQIKLYETTNVIELVYGIWEPSTNSSNYKSAAVGLKGLSNADDQLLVVIKNSSAHWDNVTFANRNYAANESFNFGRPPERPAPDAGRTFRFTPTQQHDLKVKNVYALGFSSIYYSSPQTISAVVSNVGYNTRTNIPVILSVDGTNLYADTQYISSLSFLQDTMISFMGFTPDTFGSVHISVSVPPDDFSADNIYSRHQRVTSYTLGYFKPYVEPDRGWGFPAGVQGIYYVKVPIHGTAAVRSVSTFFSNDTASIGKKVFAVVADSSGTIIDRSNDYVIDEKDLGSALLHFIPSNPVFTNSFIYVGFGLYSSLQDYAPLGVQSEVPVQPKTYFKSLITGSGLTELNPDEVPYGFMIGPTLQSTQPFAGKAFGDNFYCVGDTISIWLNGYTGFIQWQQSEDGLSEWTNVPTAQGGDLPFLVQQIDVTTYYRAEVTQPEFEAVYSNIIAVEVSPENPEVTQSGDVLISSVADGNQWYDATGPIPGAKDRYYFVTSPGTYYVIVTQNGCTSYPSNEVEIITVPTKESEMMSGIRVFPNPVLDELNIVADHQEATEVEIIGVMGMKLLREQFISARKIDLDWLSPGLYMVKLSRDKEVVVRPFIKL